MFVIFVIFVGFHQNSQRGSRGGLLECNDRSINGRWMAARHQMCEHCTALCRFLQIWVELLYKHCLPICSSGSMSTICSWFDPNRASVLKDNVRKGMIHISKYLNSRIVIYNDIQILGLKPPTISWQRPRCWNWKANQHIALFQSLSRWGMRSSYLHKCNARSFNKRAADPWFIT